VTAQVSGADPPTPRGDQGRLKASITIVDVVAIGVGATIGSSIFAVMGPAAKLSGPGFLVALGLAAIPMAAFAVVYAFMGSAIPRSGASYDWPTYFIHPYVGFTVAWLRVIGNSGALTVTTLVLVNYLSAVVRLPRRPSMWMLLTAFFVANLVGVKVAAGVERVLVLFKVAAFGVFVFAGVPFVRLSHFVPLLGHGWGSILSTMPLLVSLYLGIESATEVGEEIKNSASVIARGLAVATSLSMLIYFAVAIVTLGVLGPTRLGASDAPLLAASAIFLGKWGTPLLVCAAVAAIGTAINAVFLTFSRFLFAMGRDGSLPAVLGRIHPRWGTPHVAIIAAYTCGVAGLFLPSSLVFLFLAVNVPTVLKYLTNCVCAIRLVNHHPELHAQARFHLSRRAVGLWSCGGIACALVIVVAGLGADWRPYGILGAWWFLGTVYWLWRADRISPSELGTQRAAHDPAVASVP
jgi:basic amino acid/polyamine antiporter, APA family